MSSAVALFILGGWLRCVKWKVLSYIGPGFVR